MLFFELRASVLPGVVYTLENESWFLGISLGIFLTENWFVDSDCTSATTFGTHCSHFCSSEHWVPE